MILELVKNFSMFNRFELIGIGTSISLMAVALYLVQVETATQMLDNVSPQAATVAESGIIAVSREDDATSQRPMANALVDAADNRGNLEQMVIDDVRIGTGNTVVEGDTVQVHYIGTLRDGTEFDNSRKRGQPFEFTVGEGRVIPGWEQGLVGMREGGQRILVIPPEMAYGEEGVGPIPGNATLVFAIELLDIIE